MVSVGSTWKAAEWN